MKDNKIFAGRIKRHPDGFGFFIPDDKSEPDIYVPSSYMQGVITNDRVLLEKIGLDDRQRARGKIVEIIQRGLQTVVGRLHLLADKSGLLNEKSIGCTVHIPTACTMGALDGELVAVEIKESALGETVAGHIVAVLGDALDPLNDVRRLIYAEKIPHEFSQAVVNEAQSFKPVAESDLIDREDLRRYPFVTIDGSTAKDFDDAVCVNISDQGFKLWVAIADVSHYVSQNSAIDVEASIRGNSVYFPNYVIPMLPEVLSNDLCSLKPNVDRLVMVAEICFDFTGEPINSSFYAAVINSHARLTYGEAQEIIDGEVKDYSSEIITNVRHAADLAKILMANRFKAGSLDLEIPETEIILDESGYPLDVVKAERLFAHRLIEELMLAANVAVATYLAKAQIPMLYRIHEPPAKDAIELLSQFLITFGSSKKLAGGKLQKRISRALEEFSGKPEAQVINILTLRSMSQARYSANNAGHFGLGYDFYTHFTSPIRRYADLIVHRLLKKWLQPESSISLPGLDELTAFGNTLSGCEQRSVKIERQFNAIKKARFMAKFIGQEYEGVISSVTKFGVFVLLRTYDVDGLVRIEDLGNEKFEFDEKFLKLTGQRTGKTYSIGQSLTVLVASTASEAGQINFVLSGDDRVELDPIKPRDRQNLKKRHKAQKHSKRFRQARVSRGRRKN